MIQKLILYIIPKEKAVKIMKKIIIYNKKITNKIIQNFCQQML